MSRPDLDQLLTELESFFEQLGEIEGFDITADHENPADEGTIASLSKALGYPIPSEIATMWRRGFISTSGEMEHDSFIAIGRDFCTPDIVLRDLAELRQIGTSWESAPTPGTPTAEFIRLAREGFPLSFENPVLASDASGAIYYLNYKDCEARKVAESLSAHLCSWVGAGAFSQLDEESGGQALVEAVRDILPEWAEAAPNAWSEMYREIYFD